MKKSKMWPAIALMMAVNVTGCSKDDSAPEPNIERRDIVLSRAEQQVLINGNNDFAFNLFRQVTASQESQDGLLAESKLLSPLSITFALGMLNNGAVGETQAQISRVLGFGDMGADSINTFCHKMMTEMTQLDNQTKLLIANNIYMNKGYELKDDFTAKVWAYYEATPETRDFADGQTMDVINRWANDHTEGMIPRILNESEFDPTAVSYLLNAIYFKGTWTHQFDKDDTQEEPFTSYGAEKVLRMKPMMHQTSVFDYTENDDCQALRLPYGNGAFTATILLPRKEKTVSEILQSLTADTWQEQYQNMSSMEVDVKLPRFETKSDIDLKTVMAALGMPDAFDAMKADFSNFCHVDTYIDLMKQMARIKVNEEGAEAAAVTVIGMIEACAGPDPKIEFHADRPFLYVISEVSSGVILFIGQYMGD